MWQVAASWSSPAIRWTAARATPAADDKAKELEAQLEAEKEGRAAAIAEVEADRDEKIAAAEQSSAAQILQHVVSSDGRFDTWFKVLQCFQDWDGLISHTIPDEAAEHMVGTIPKPDGVRVTLQAP